MKKKGFTLVELIAAVAIFAITISAISLAFSTSISTWSKGDLKLGTSTYAQSIIETIRSQGADKIKTMYNDAGGSSCYIYFDDNMTNLRVYNNAAVSTPTDLLTWVKGGTSKLAGTVGESFASCNNSAYSGGKKYGAYLYIKQSDAVNKVYYVRVRVWNLQRSNGSGSESLREVYISR